MGYNEKVLQKDLGIEIRVLACNEKFELAIIFNDIRQMMAVFTRYTKNDAYLYRVDDFAPNSSCGDKSPYKVFTDRISAFEWIKDYCMPCYRHEYAKIKGITGFKTYYPSEYKNM